MVSANVVRQAGVVKWSDCETHLQVSSTASLPLVTASRSLSTGEDGDLSHFHIRKLPFWARGRSELDESHLFYGEAASRKAG